MLSIAMSTWCTFRVSDRARSKACKSDANELELVVCNGSAIRLLADAAVVASDFVDEVFDRLRLDFDLG